MKGLTRSLNSCVILFVVLSWALLTRFTVQCSCGVSDKELWAFSNPSIETFNDSYHNILSSDKGQVCQWIITSSDKEQVVRLTFPTFLLKNAAGLKGDCLEIYNGKTAEAPLLDQLCDKLPAEYTSTGRFILVIYRRGQVEGDRSFSMAFSSLSVMTKEAIIRIAGIIGAALAAVGLTYVIFRATRCCRCLRHKGDNSGSNNATRSGMQERDRLTHVVVEDGDNDENTQNTTASTTHPNQSHAVNATSGSSPFHEPGDSTPTEPNHESDTDSLQEMNEPPPSYESLYLNEQGEPVTPPPYSPPKHKTSHPPRRVHTFK